ncbi:MAG: hypothetical protein HY076_04615 [Candidatus Eisenbacteria bacterium]|uniref:Uncharacterized protein n=1 Tax=Eiseniibacteriota bacterium TaxID=2212470 RepID=A0A9D6L5Z4_UNCEI|nr:hypothetical protein [Candidatus Eisenbacteria bacterium]
MTDRDARVLECCMDAARRVASPLLLGGMWIALLSAAGCHDAAAPQQDARRGAATADPCAVEPLEAFDASIDGGGGIPAASFAGRVAEISPTDGFGRTTYRIVESGGAEHHLVLRDEGPSPVRVNGSYDFHIERVAGTPGASALLVRDGQGLVFAGASDDGIGAHVLAAGVEGFTLRLDPVSCASRGSGDCYRAAINRALAVGHNGAAASLYPRDEADLGAYHVRCLIAQQIEYAGCPDFALHGVSFTITRVK